MGDDGSAMDEEPRSDISSIYINGFPEDTKEREVLNMLHFFMGFTDAMLNRTDKGVVAFAKFETPQAASNACGLLDNHQFDHAYPMPLRCSMAKRDMEVRERTSLKREHPTRVQPAYNNMSYMPPYQDPWAPLQPYSSGYGDQRYMPQGYGYMAPQPSYMPEVHKRQRVGPPAENGRNDTICIRNLTDHATERDV